MNRIIRLEIQHKHLHSELYCGHDGRVRRPADPLYEVTAVFLCDLKTASAFAEWMRSRDMPVETPALPSSDPVQGVFDE